MCILILNLTMLYSYFHFSIQFLLKHTYQISCTAKKKKKLNSCATLLMMGTKQYRTG